MAGSGPPNDAYGYSHNDSRLGEQADELFKSAEDPSPWYLKPWVLALWGLAVVILIATIIWGLVALASGSGGGRPPSSTITRSSTTKPSPTITTTPPDTTMPAAPPETTEPPAPAAPSIPAQTWTQPPRRHWWNGNLPNVPNVPNLPHVPHHNP